MLHPTSNTLTRAAAEGLQLLRFASATLAPGSSCKFSTQTQPISSAQPTPKYADVVTTYTADGLQDGCIKIHLRVLSLASQEATNEAFQQRVLRTASVKDSFCDTPQLTVDHWDAPSDPSKLDPAQYHGHSATNSLPVSTAYSTVTADEGTGGVEVKWFGHTGVY